MLGAGELFALVHYELLLFASVFFLVGALDELAVDCAYLWLRWRGRIGSQTMPQETPSDAPLCGPAAVFIPAWAEAAVIGATVRYALAAWAHADLRVFVGCYQNDPATIAAVRAVAGDQRLQLVIVPRDGPTSKADCLNHLYTAMLREEVRTKARYRMVVLHDAEDMVDPAALSVLDQAIGQADFVQLPVLALPQRHSRWVAGHYSDEFAEAHGKTMPVRDALGGGVPGAGVGCAIARGMLDRLACLAHDDNGRAVPFAVQSLTEDYELGLNVSALGGRARFLAMRHPCGSLVATRAYFPDSLRAAVRQKTRWTHGIALQGWDRLGWHGGLVKLWMQARDRRGPLAALLLAIAYCLIAVQMLGWSATAIGYPLPSVLSPFLRYLLVFNFAIILWRAAFRYAFTAREFGRAEGVRAIMRIPVSNVVAIMAGRRAVIAYLRSLRGEAPRWDKTNHALHPATFATPATSATPDGPVVRRAA